MQKQTDVASLRPLLRNFLTALLFHSKMAQTLNEEGDLDLAATAFNSGRPEYNVQLAVQLLVYVTELHGIEDAVPIKDIYTAATQALQMDRGSIPTKQVHPIDPHHTAKVDPICLLQPENLLEGRSS